MHLSNSIKQVEDVASRAFSPLLERQVHHRTRTFNFFPLGMSWCVQDVHMISAMGGHRCSAKGKLLCAGKGLVADNFFWLQAQVERIRSVQGMLQRFRTLFNLPSSIRTHISKGEYDQAIREYKKAKSLELYSHVRDWIFVCSI